MSEIPLIKVLIKVLEERSDKLVWEHVCYVTFQHRSQYDYHERSSNLEGSDQRQVSNRVPVHFQKP